MYHINNDISNQGSNLVRSKIKAIYCVVLAYEPKRKGGSGGSPRVPGRAGDAVGAPFMA